ncbi:hypothetical protein BDV95DRAFT_610960 [Massariosphaeria phaeospora]|uniref:Uncharacterized protein n=1 Tax=Massariosphaeria phaeospora TaxID=100035 RepID=A0A7C8I076_9PLEO|nr:hypothetical protein BDV95DRAFT_610960 [Massariosphaeria phaeospora]
MRSFLLLLAAAAIPSFASPIATPDGTPSTVLEVDGVLIPIDVAPPKFENKNPESVNVTAIPGEPPNCGIGMVRETNMVGDGAPKKWTFWKQLSDPVHCNEGTCHVSHQSQTSFTVGFSASGQVNRWISAGFNVESTFSTGTSEECDGERNEVVCVWSFKHYYTYSVKNIEYPMDPRCGRLTEGPTVRMDSPLAGTKGRGYGCYRGNDCKDLGETAWTENWHGQ